MKKLLMTGVVLVLAAIAIGMWFRESDPIRIALPSFEQSYLKKAEIFIRKSGANDCDVLFLLTADKESFYRWRNWGRLLKKEEGGIIFPEEFVVALYDATGFDIGTLKIPSSTLDHRDDVDEKTIVLGSTTRSQVPYSKAKNLRTFKVSFLYEVK